LSVLFGFATSVPELGTVGYELNSCRIILEKQELFYFDFGLIIYVIFKLKLSQKERIQSFFENTKKEIKTDLGTNGLNTGGSYNLEGLP
jgi:S-DNA-T family DNA segregation ATPase FtsK/SpoIIIE